MDRTGRGRRCPAFQELVAEPLVVSLSVVVLHVFADELPQVTLTERDDLVEALDLMESTKRSA